MSARTHYDVLIVGAGHGGAQAAMALRKFGFAGAVALVGADAEPPYDRPPLSKDYLAGTKSFERMLLRPERFWADQRIELILGKKTVAVDPSAHRLRCEDGTEFAYDNVIWAAGGAPRMLTCEGRGLRGVHAVRSRADVDRMKAELDAAKDVVVVGGGYIGLEAAAVLTKLGKKVTVLEALDRPLARVAGPEISRFYEAEHRARGVDLRTGVKVDCMLGENGRAAGVRLADGEIMSADMIVVGIGIDPCVEPLLAAGATEENNGVLVDEYCRTSLADIYAVGDCAAHANRYAGGAVIRLESVQNANDQAATAARAIAGDPRPYDAVPWFWSDQYDLKLQTVGLSTGHDQTVLRGDPATRSFSVVYLKEGRVIALDCVNAARDYVQGRRLVMEGARIDTARLADATTPLVEPPKRGR